MPMAIPLIAAAGSIAAGMAATSAIVGGLMIASGVLTGVGALTGNQKMMKIGGILSLAGGVAGLAQGLAGSAANEVASQAAQDVVSQEALNAAGGAAGEMAADAAGQAAAEAATQAAGESSKALLYGDAAYGPAMSGAETATFDAASGAGGLAGAEGAGGGLAGDGPGLIEGQWGAEATAPTLQSNPIPQVVDSPVQPLVADAPRVDIYGESTTGALADGTSATGTTGAGGSTGNLSSAQRAELMGPKGYTGEEPSWFDRASQWIKNNKEAAKIGADVIKGGAQGYMQNRQQDAQFQREDEWRARYNQGVRQALSRSVPRYQPPPPGSNPRPTLVKG